MTDKLSSLALDHDSFISLHAQLHNRLRRLIVSGQWQYGEQVPSETQLAKHLNISRTTVRIALQSGEVEGLIERVAGRGTFVSYVPEEENATRLIGYITRSFHNNIHRTLLTSIEAELRSAGCRVIFSSASNNADECAVLEQLMQENIDGLVLWPNANPTPQQKDLLRQYQLNDIPIVFVDRNVEGIEADFVTSDHIGGTTMLVNHLIELGHEHIAYLMANIPGLYPIEQRLKGYRQAMHAAGQVAQPALRPNSPHRRLFFETDIHELLSESHTEILDQLVELLRGAQPQPTAVVCVNDALAVLTMRALNRLGLKVPGDISVVGFDDISLAAHMPVPLTTIRQDAHVIGTTAAQMLVDRLDGLESAPRTETIPTRIQRRASTSVTPASRKQDVKSIYSK